ncbi:hypothetical protein MNEG_8595 [Monoraphidium neglectum]|uniref:Increased DNA methylation 1 C-terminal domain-containing protein n=1 Tax=Monoraphidium neglectum TaxID=145388 RepID=A0A0D2JJ74_9CHLO|nr:hypothetical protein MNEG_8595 [Monoraphidium neglectum]KIY99367.1 hypothetical protein MNEG_8595 [Monoraphidium neglectum]|eukprot:XP_013898387.1 hypothetical protein MNEG_8595 [Monoraphidium neglectum]
MGTRAPAAPLSSLAAATRAAPADSSEESAGISGEGGEGSSSESGDDTASQVDLQFLQSVNCASCSKPLLSRAQRRGGRSGVDPGDYLVCDGCRRCFHERCCERSGVATGASRDGSWFHDEGCKRAAAALQQQASKGAAALPGGRAWQLVPLRRGLGGRDGVGAKKQQLHALLEVLAPEYGPGVADQLLDGTGYALLLTSGTQPITAATLDVYGTDLAAVDLFTTKFELRAQGHGTALLHAAEQFLGSKARVRRLLAVAAADEPDALGVMTDKFGFSRLNGRQARALASEFPALQFYERSVLLSKDLSSAARAARLKAATAKAGAAQPAAGGGTLEGGDPAGEGEGGALAAAGSNASVEKRR